MDLDKRIKITKFEIIFIPLLIIILLILSRFFDTIVIHSSLIIIFFLFSLLNIIFILKLSSKIKSITKKENIKKWCDISIYNNRIYVILFLLTIFSEPKSFIIYFIYIFPLWLLINIIFVFKIKDY